MKPGPTGRREEAAGAAAAAGGVGATCGSGAANVNRSVASSFVAAVAACVDAGGVAPGGVRGVNDSYIEEVPSAETASSCAAPGPWALEPILRSISESSVITAEALRFLTQALMDGGPVPPRSVLSACGWATIGRR